MQEIRVALRQAKHFGQGRNLKDDSGRLGRIVAAVGTDRVIIGALGDRTGGLDAGAAYLFSVLQTPGSPTLSIARTTTNTVAVFWPSPSTDYILQQNTNRLRPQFGELEQRGDGPLG